MFGGTIAKSGSVIQGTSRSHAYQDVWQEARAIEYYGELTPEVCEAIKTAWLEHQRTIKGVSGYGALRWPSPDNFVRVDVEQRAVIVACAINLAD